MAGLGAEPAVDTAIQVCTDAAVHGIGKLFQRLFLFGSQRFLLCHAFRLDGGQTPRFP